MRENKQDPCRCPGNRLRSNVGCFTLKYYLTRTKLAHFTPPTGKAAAGQVELTYQPQPIQHPDQVYDQQRSYPQLQA